MTLQLAPTHWLVRFTTGAVICLDAVFYLLSVWNWPMLIPAALLTVLIGVTWLAWAPVAYEISEGNLDVRFRIFILHYGRIVSAAAMEAPMRRWAGLFRNGGLFAISGIFWTRHLGSFRAHVSTTTTAHLLLVQTDRYRVVISPEHPEQVMQSLATVR